MKGVSALLATQVAIRPALAVAQGSYVDRLWAAGPGAEALLRGTAKDWVTSPEIVKDRAGFVVFSKPFPRKNLISQDDLTRCITRLAHSAPSSAPVSAMVVWYKVNAIHDNK